VKGGKNKFSILIYVYKKSFKKKLGETVRRETTNVRGNFEPWAVTNNARSSWLKAHSCFVSTRVRRKGRCHNELKPGSKNSLHKIFNVTFF